MEDKNFVETLATRFGQAATVKNLYGDPVTTNGKTIIPVAHIAMGLGGGYGHRNGKHQATSFDAEQKPANRDEGAGGGGGMYATAKGVFEITAKHTRFIPANAAKQMLSVAAGAFIIGRWMGRRNSRKEPHKALKEA